MKLFIVILLLLPILASAQEKSLPIDSTTKLVTYEGTVEVKGASKDELYSRGKEWFARTFTSSNDVIQMDDKQSGKIIGEGISLGSYIRDNQTAICFLKYAIAITLKDQRYRYEITSFIIDLKASGITAPVEVYLQDKHSGLDAIKLTDTMKKKALEAQKLVASQIIDFTKTTGTSLSVSLQAIMNKAVKSKYEF